jgi:NitT/TauT family transport system ATP-binding protein
MRSGLALVHGAPAPAPTLLAVNGVSKSFPQGRREPKVVIEHLAFELAQGELLCIIGPSGCGKTTLLRCLCGLAAPSAGEVLYRGEPVRRPRPETALVFQDYGRALMPWMSVRGNVEFPLRSRIRSRAERRRIVEEAVDAVGLAHAIDLAPWQLSGGMQQRVAIARALAYQPECLLMDEPFGSVDAQTREDLEDLLLRLKAAFGITVAVVTHDIDEAVYLGDRVVVLTPAPTTVREIIDVPFGAERDQVRTKEDPRFGHLRAQVYQLLKGRAPGTDDR